MAETIDKDPVAPVLGNPAVVGLGGFGMTTMLLQFHNLGWMGITPVIWSGFVFGGVGQLIAGFQEQKTGNNFGYAAFAGYGAFWIILCAYLLGSTTGNKMLALNENDVGFFLFGYTLFTAGLWIASFKISKAMFLTFLTLLIGFILLDLVFWGRPSLKPIAAWDLIVCALTAWYMMFHVVFRSVFGRDVLPVGAPLA
ncbi:acetate uptake transporter [Rhodoblastus acidophilus]|uniref:Acetate uptake transporter n=1 Tax=Candidatus Rhodoblastus alkanivorans TaxID=2954117 RepID=A0ABS9Z5C5_9HYPH|nr:acetate uptake transporter [Candidatus Rhodoblastus alkanivorans]MCI4678492.1 acetate uptake transporter [Candidatus Rhodoblastus alkanivorans]MCI4682834.1 acetate uptake transporter [Candidatus Rhodoblastus alkanivorans]MDI4640144.1 acetate uptake transporter [Rhodoblastus acidophilus]